MMMQLQLGNDIFEVVGDYAEKVKDMAGSQEVCFLGELLNERASVLLGQAVELLDEGKLQEAHRLQRYARGIEDVAAFIKKPYVENDKP